GCAAAFVTLEETSVAPPAAFATSRRVISALMEASCSTRSKAPVQFSIRVGPSSSWTVVQLPEGTVKMSALGHLRQFLPVSGMSAFPPIATEQATWLDVGQGPIASFWTALTQVRSTLHRRHEATDGFNRIHKRRTFDPGCSSPLVSSAAASGA